MNEVHNPQGTGSEEYAVMPPIGYTLRAAREARGETLQDVAASLKLTGRQVEALETDRFDLLPGRAFARGFLRNYARHLHLDPAPLLAALDEQAAGDAMDLAPVSNAVGTMPSSGERLRPSSLPVALIAFGLFLVVLAGWYFNWFQQPAPQDEVVAQETLLPPEPTALDSPAAGPDTVSPTVVAGAGDAEGALPAGVAPSVEGSVQGGAVSTTPAAGAAALEEKPAAEAAAGDRLDFRFEREAWFEVRDADGKVLFSGTGREGTAKEVIGKAPFKLVVGNARYVKLEHNGREIDMIPHIRVTVARFKVE